jgi:D-alanine-D-alanine ligase
MQVVIVYNCDLVPEYGDQMDLVAIQDTEHTAASIYSALKELGYSVHLIPVSESLEELWHKLAPFSPADTFIFHNCDGFQGRSMGGAYLVKEIEQLGFAHTGSTSTVIRNSTDKGITKQLLQQAGIPTPAFQICQDPGAEITVPFPVIVKPVAEDASLGITLSSVARTRDAVPALVQHILDSYHQPALVEEFIVGRELICALLGNGPETHLLPISEIDYSPVKDPLEQLLTYESKWVEGTLYFDQIVSHCPADLTAGEQAAVENAVIQAFTVLGMRDFCRVDLRLKSGIPYILDVNDLPDLAPASGFARTAMAAGYTYPGILETILNIALTREGWHGARD